MTLAGIDQRRGFARRDLQSWRDCRAHRLLDDPVPVGHGNLSLPGEALGTEVCRRLAWLLLRRRVHLDDVGIEIDLCLKVGLGEGGIALRDHHPEEGPHQCQGDQDREHSEPAEDPLKKMPPAKTCADARPPPFRARGGNGKGISHQSYCSRKRRTMNKARMFNSSVMAKRVSPRANPTRDCGPAKSRSEERRVGK